MSISPGQQFGSYEVVEPIGAGGMGEVWRARDTELKRDVAVKVLPASFAADADRLARFRREAELLASLNHANIAQVYGLEKVDDQMVIVMELIEGPTLADKLKEGPIPPDEAMNIGLQIVSALEAAHANQIVHRDLKPANVKLKDDGTVKVLDFGISKSIDPQAISGSPVMTTPAVTQTGVILGTAAYMSPEQARGKFVDERTDVWAFGCLLFEMLTGQPAFGGEDVMLTLARVLDRDTDLSSIPKTISPAVRHTIKLCLQKDPRRRIADIRDVRLALEGTFETEMPRAAEIVAARPLWRRAAWSLAMLVVGLVAAGAAAWTLMQPEPPQVTRFAHQLPAGVPFHSIGDPILAISPKGDTIAYGAGNALWLRPLGELEARRLDQIDTLVPIHLVFSPDGESLAYWSPTDRRLMRVSVAGGSPVPITSVATPPMAPRWTGDDRILYAQPGQILAVSANGSEEPSVVVETNGLAAGPILLPGGKHLLYSLSGTVVAVDLATQETHALFPGVLPYYLDSGHLVYFDGDGLLARTFDPDSLEFGGPVSVVDDVFRLRSGSAPQFALSDNGTLVYIEGQSASGGQRLTLAIADSDGNVEPLDVPERDYAYPSVSPDGKRIAVEIRGDDGDSEIYLYDLSGASEMRPLTNSGGVNSQPSWKDERTVLFASDRDGRQRIYQQSIDGGGATVLTGPEEGDTHNFPVVTPDDKLLVTTTSAVLVQPFDGEPEPLLNHATAQAGGSFSPDGSELAYIAIGTGGQPRVFIVPYPPDTAPYPPDAAGVPASPDDEVGLWPIWIDSGTGGAQSILYQDPRQQSVKIVDVALPEIAFSNRRTLMNYGTANGEHAISAIPGTNRFVIVQAKDSDVGAVQASVDRIVVIENFKELLKERVR